MAEAADNQQFIIKKLVIVTANRKKKHMTGCHSLKHRATEYTAHNFLYSIHYQSVL